MSCETTFNTYQQSNPVKKCGSVTAKRAYLFQTKELIRQALNAKGLDVTTDDTFRSYAEYIMQLPSLNNVVTSIIDAEGEKHVGDVTIDKAFIGLDKVDNTTDLEKPISNATQVALDLKANKNATGIVIENWRAQLQINNVDNTSDADKPVSAAMQTALDKKADKTDTLAGYGITDAKIEEGVITLGENTITPLTSTSLINGANVTGVVPEARKATRDSDNNIISETYAKNVEFNTALNQKQNREDNSLVTPNKTITDAINDAWNYASKNNGDLNTTIAGTNSNIDFNTWGANLGIPEIKTSVDGKQDKLTAGAYIEISDANVISVSGIPEGAVTSVNNVSPDETGNVTIAAANISDAYTKTEVNTELGKKQDKLTAGTNISISDTNAISVTGLSKSSVGLGNVDNTSDANKPISIATQTALDTKQDKLNFYSEVDKSDDTSIDATGSEINLKTLASQYGGSSINLTASNGQYKSGNINLKAKSYDTSNGGNITLETEGGSASGGNITLHSKFNSGGMAEPGGKISLMADGNSNAYGESNILLSANSIQLDGNLKGTALNTSIPVEPDDNHILTTKAVATAIEGKANKSTTLSGYGITDAKIESGVITLGNNTITPLTATSSIPANLIAGIVDSADKAINDADGNPISTTYAKSTDVNAELALKQNITDNTLATTAKTIPAAINEVNSALSSKQDISNLVTAFSATTSDTKYPSEKLVYSSLGTLSQSITSLENDTQALSNNKANKSTTLAGYNIGDAYTKDDVDTKLNLKQDKTDDSLNTTSKTIVGGINELVANKQNNLTTYTESETSATLTSDSIILNGALGGSGISSTISGNADSDKSKVPTVAAVYDSIQSLKVTSTVNTTVTPEAIEAATAITDALAKSARVVVNPNIANTGAVYIQESDTYTPINPIYPDPTNNVYEFVNMQNVKVFIDSLGDSVDLRIEYKG